MELNLALIWYHSYQLGIAFLLALPIALNREYKARGAGMRTYPLVSIACCAFMLVARDVYEGDAAEARVMYGIITGMGFIGGGAIMKNNSGVSGTASAAGIWLTGAIGLSVAYARYEIAIVLTLMGFLIFQVVSFFKHGDKT
ncbi:magnesium transporter MgtC [Methylophaga nitratireducenticrescens]|jgi:putative Mg2+ transporter-C (MgtC) family protein|uniref:Protein MgtC n=1 Tax=Pseudidiomarina aestuarii TaxID=624146 RepID=A0A2T4CYA4_9GAMM|nr:MULTISPECIES: MgtC/SapB family protein [unclassified Methylophaga]PTB82919.1 magnesium transporter MgtC [Methylophaga nitratireducenticrescens]PTB86547.1 magnesium transporter MgtC [Pseudidiomarina aestuarii]MAL50231.1 magnesium transporter MgtC [Methylophaga sp.]MAP27478.1 magnesium transporter MgtC [Methylophaga sp.]MBP25549.1 magnesium transporter MgtC [Methylophaga sp.]|tara:strand:- start:3705 stop:4130 length:426 start_codon:yes stop_codon:yes gene_type:complete